MPPPTAAPTGTPSVPGTQASDPSPPGTPPTKPAGDSDDKPAAGPSNPVEPPQAKEPAPAAQEKAASDAAAATQAAAKAAREKTEADATPPSDPFINLDARGPSQSEAALDRMANARLEGAVMSPSEASDAEFLRLVSKADQGKLVKALHKRAPHETVSQIFFQPLDPSAATVLSDVKLKTYTARFANNSEYHKFMNWANDYGFGSAWSLKAQATVKGVGVGAGYSSSNARESGTRSMEADREDADSAFETTFVVAYTHVVGGLRLRNRRLSGAALDELRDLEDEEDDAERGQLAEALLEGYGDHAYRGEYFLGGWMEVKAAAAGSGSAQTAFKTESAGSASSRSGGAHLGVPTVVDVGASGGSSRHESSASQDRREKAHHTTASASYSTTHGGLTSSPRTLIEQLQKDPSALQVIKFETERKHNLKPVWEIVGALGLKSAASALEQAYQRMEPERVKMEMCQRLLEEAAQHCTELCTFGSLLTARPRLNDLACSPASLASHTTDGNWKNGRTKGDRLLPALSEFGRTKLDLREDCQGHCVETPTGLWYFIDVPSRGMLDLKGFESLRQSAARVMALAGPIMSDISRISASQGLAGLKGLSARLLELAGYELAEWEYWVRHVRTAGGRDADAEQFVESVRELISTLREISTFQRA